MAARITAAEARRLGVDIPSKARTTRKTARGPYRTVCVLCGEQFTTVASEDRHLTGTGHPRYALVVEVAS